jgi:hypothetical protein
MLTRALPPVPRFPAMSSDDISGGRVMTVPVPIQDQRSVFLVHICAGRSRRGGCKKLQEDILYGFMRYEAPGGGARRRRAVKARCYTACGGLVRLDGVLDDAGPHSMSNIDARQPGAVIDHVRLC